MTKLKIEKTFSIDYALVYLPPTIQSLITNQVVHDRTPNVHFRTKKILET